MVVLGKKLCPWLQAFIEIERLVTKILDAIEISMKRIEWNDYQQKSPAVCEAFSQYPPMGRKSNQVRGGFEGFVWIESTFRYRARVALEPINRH